MISVATEGPLWIRVLGSQMAAAAVPVERDERVRRRYAALHRRLEPGSKGLGQRHPFRTALVMIAVGWACIAGVGSGRLGFLPAPHAGAASSAAAEPFAQR